MQYIRGELQWKKKAKLQVVVTVAGGDGKFQPIRKVSFDSF